jgi:hypothetical protein
MPRPTTNHWRQHEPSVADPRTHGAQPPLLLELDARPPSEPEAFELPEPTPPELPVADPVELPVPAPELVVEPVPPLLLDPVAIVPPEEPDAELAMLPSGDAEPGTLAVPPPSRDASVWGSTPTTASHPEIMSPHRQASAGRRGITMLLSTARRSGQDPVVPRGRRLGR